MKQIEIRNLSMGYGSLVVVKSFDLDIEAGETLVLLGPSGCGKTTTMRGIAGLETPIGGTITLGGQPVFDANAGVNVPIYKRGVGMVFQSYAIWPHMSVFENVAFPLRMARADRKAIGCTVESMLELVGLGGMGDRGGSQLSGGQMQRVALARSLAMGPKVILFDEPLSNLDAKLRDGLRFELKQIQQKFGFTAIYVTHDQSEALALGDRIAVLKGGAIMQLSSPAELYNKPKSAFVADFLGIPNFFRGEQIQAEGNCTAIRLNDTGMIVRSTQETPTGQGSIVGCARPTSMTLSDARPSDAINCWKGRIEASSFLGNVVRYRVQLENGLDLEVSSEERRPAPREIGSPVHVLLPPEDVILVRD